MKNTRLCGLYVITDPELIPDKRLTHTVEQAVLGGARLVQYRNKRAGVDRALEQVRDLLALCHAHEIPLIVDDDADLVLQTGADGIHIGKGDTRLEEARARLGKETIIGVSCYNQIEPAIRAQQTGADYVAFGSFFPSPTKPDAALADIGLLRQGKHKLRIPICAIGGITADNARPLRAAGADMLAVISAVFSAADVKKAAEEFSKQFD